MALQLARLVPTFMQQVTAAVKWGNHNAGGDTHNVNGKIISENTNITRMLLKSLLKQLAGLIPNVVAQLIDVARERNFKASTNNNHETGGINNHKSEGGLSYTENIYGGQS